ncbi:MAG TPA: hypothetical protein PLS10_13855 [Chitinophagales bacterium]|nr:hypothetical protein [Chitinophagales bacterium]
MLQTPVLFLIFNRPDRTIDVFEQIRKQQPEKLYIVSDGARATKEGERQLVQKCREIIHKIDWRCEIKTLFRDENLGSGMGVFEGINWFFEQEEQGIILEDDCLANDSFFHFCEAMLNKYQKNDKIMLISGCNYLLGLIDIKDSYYFSQVPATWGWATWRRAWKHMNYDMTGFDEKVKKFPAVAEMWQHHWEAIKNGGGVRDAWDFQWYFSIYEQQGICIHPKVNLVQNTGFDTPNATHTFRAPWWYKFVITNELKIINHPDKIKINTKADEFVKQRFLNNQLTFLQRIRLKLKQLTK